MANFRIKQFNYNNVTSYKDILETNRNRMDELFRKYQGELQNVESNWMGQSGRVSQEDMQKLINDYNGFLNKVNDFITVLAASQNSFVETENQNISTYNM